ncbi:flagellar biosynthesis protein FlhB [Chitinimonas sp.]|uniref:EscU/YscU/HrcU family type III secretion system export apparatus switch protein n=1 Tax=Chitinimonas sp. TaxID=1934313 RepID=UPI0035B2D620
MAEDGQERNEDATPHKLREAQKRGQVAKSQEVNVAAVLAVLVAACYAVLPGMARHQAQLAQALFSRAGHTDWSEAGMLHRLQQLLNDSLASLAPLLIAIAGAVIIANIAQTGAVFSAEPLKPDFTKLNPSNGLQRLFSLRLLYEALRSLLKLTALGLVLWSAIHHLLPDLFSLSQRDAHAQAAGALSLVGPLLFKLLLVALLIALLDLAYTRWDFAKKMRMSRRDIEDEHKQREGDPRIRSRLRQLRNEMLKQSQSMRRVPEADVLITNPTHIAIALSYRHGEMPAPKLLAKGAGGLAAKMRSVARSHHIPVVENPPLARELYKRLGTDQYLPEDLYPRVARILIWVYAMRRARQQVAA